MGGSDHCSALVTLVNTIVTLLTPQSIEDIASSTALKNGDTFDFIIVGGGSAGCVLANRMSEIGDYSVLLLEAGGEEPEMAKIPGFFPALQGSNIDWGYLTEPQPQYNGGKPLLWPRGKMLGGCSSINNLIYNRGNKKDYDSWAQLGNKGWTYEEVFPYFKKSENNLDEEFAKDTEYHSTGGYLDVQRYPHTDENARDLVKGFKDLGFQEIDVNRGNMQGVMYLQATQRDGVRMSTYSAFIEPIRKKRNNLKVVTNARVFKILFDEKNKTAIGVEFYWEKSTTNVKTIYARKEVIISAGALNSPQILMLSGIGPKEHLESFGIDVIRDLPGVGQHLLDHTGAASCIYRVAPGKEVFPRTYEDIERDAANYRSSRAKSPWAATGLCPVTAYLSTGLGNSSFNDPDIQYHNTAYLPHSCPLPIAYPYCYYEYFAIVPYIMRPDSQGYLSLRSPNANDLVRIISNAFTKESDVAPVVEGLKKCASLKDTPTFKKAGFKLVEKPVPGCENHIFGTDEYWRCTVYQKTVSIYHPVGTCKMGPSSDPTAVVDPKLRVHGIKHLRVIDASIMPTHVTCNTNAPTIMIAEKGADLIKQSWKK